MIKIGIAGAGHLGCKHLKVLKELENEIGIKVSAVYDINKNSSSKAAKEFNFKEASSFDELINESDAIDIITSTSSHFELCKKAIEHGKHIFVEKPITTNTSEADELILLASKKKIKAQAGHIERFNPAILAIEKYNIQPVFIESHRLAQFSGRSTDISVISDLMIHDIDIILNLVNSKVKKISANGAAIITDKTDIANARITFESGAVANVTASRISQSPMRKMRLFQKNSYISIDFQKNESEIFKLVKESDDETIGIDISAFGNFNLPDNSKIFYEKATVEDINPLKYELKLFIESIINNTEPIVSLVDGKQALEVAEIIIKEVNQSVSISENDL